MALSLSIYINITQAVSDWDTSPLHHLHYSSGWTLNVFPFGYSNQGQWQLLIKCKTFAIFVSLTMIWVLILSRMKRGKKCSIDIGRILGKNEHDGSKLSSQNSLSISNVTSQEKGIRPFSDGHTILVKTSFEKMSWFEYWKHAFLKVIRVSCKVLYQHCMLLRYVGIVFWMQKIKETFKRPISNSHKQNVLLQFRFPFSLDIRPNHTKTNKKTKTTKNQSII